MRKPTAAFPNPNRQTQPSRQSHFPVFIAVGQLRILLDQEFQSSLTSIACIASAQFTSSRKQLVDKFTIGARLFERTSLSEFGSQAKSPTTFAVDLHHPRLYSHIRQSNDQRNSKRCAKSAPGRSRSSKHTAKSCAGAAFLRQYRQQDIGRPAVAECKQTEEQRRTVIVQAIQHAEWRPRQEALCDY